MKNDFLRHVGGRAPVTNNYDDAAEGCADGGHVVVVSTRTANPPPDVEAKGRNKLVCIVHVIGLSNYRYHFEVYLRYMILDLHLRRIWP